VPFAPLSEPAVLPSLGKSPSDARSWPVLHPDTCPATTAATATCAFPEFIQKTKLKDI